VIPSYLLYVAEKSKKRKKVLHFLEYLKSFIPVLPIPEKAGNEYGCFRASLESEKKPVGNNDLWIAAHAKASAIALVTNNVREFSRVPGLNVQDWVV
jgi:tRNA(fMet)-specific endonuclease VapC